MDEEDNPAAEGVSQLGSVFSPNVLDESVEPDLSRIERPLSLGSENFRNTSGASSFDYIDTPTFDKNLDKVLGQKKGQSLQKVLEDIRIPPRRNPPLHKYVQSPDENADAKNVDDDHETSPISQNIVVQANEGQFPGNDQPLHDTADPPESRDDAERFWNESAIAIVTPTIEHGQHYGSTRSSDGTRTSGDLNGGSIDAKYDHLLLRGRMSPKIKTHCMMTRQDTRWQRKISGCPSADHGQYDPNILDQNVPPISQPLKVVSEFFRRSRKVPTGTVSEPGKKELRLLSRRIWSFLSSPFKNRLWGKYERSSSGDGHGKISKSLPMELSELLSQSGSADNGRPIGSDASPRDTTKVSNDEEVDESTRVSQREPVLDLFRKYEPTDTLKFNRTLDWIERNRQYSWEAQNNSRYGNYDSGLMTLEMLKEVKFRLCTLISEPLSMHTSSLSEHHYAESARLGSKGSSAGRLPVDIHMEAKSVTVQETVERTGSQVRISESEGGQPDNVGSPGNLNGGLKIRKEVILQQAGTTVQVFKRSGAMLCISQEQKKRLGRRFMSPI